LRSSLRRTLDRVSKLFRREARVGTQTSPDAKTAVETHAESHAALFERAERLRTKADRLDREGTPSESARNRARRAEEEVEAGLRELRSFLVANGVQTQHAFDREVARCYPRLRFSDE